MANLPGPSGPQAILFATDSRLTDLSTMKTYDVGEKLFPICGNVGLVYAGITRIGISCVQRLQESWEAKESVECPEVLENACSVFREEYVVCASQGEPLVFMLGVYDFSLDQPRLFGYQYPNFDVSEMKGVNAIGSSNHIRELYKQKYEEFVKWRFSHGGVSDNPIEWLNYVQIVLNNEVIELGLDPTVGGLVQTAIVDKGGFNWVAHSVRKVDGKWTETSRDHKNWRVIEVNSKKEIARTKRFQDGIFNISE